MASASLLHLCILFFSLLHLPALLHAATRNTYNGYVLPVTKDGETLQYVTTIKTGTPLVSVNLVVDLGGLFSWVYWDQNYTSSSFHPVPCKSHRCKLAKGFGCNGCYLAACGKKSWCGIIVDNGESITATALSQDVVVLQSTYKNGSRLGPFASINRFPISGSMTTFLLENLAAGAKGMLALSRSYNAMPQQLLLSTKHNSAFGGGGGSYPNIFSLCMPSSTTAKGGIYFGAGPHMVLPANFEASKMFSYTQLITNPVGTSLSSSASDVSHDYFIPVGSISIDSIPIPLDKSLLVIDQNGLGGTKISTTVAYTILQSSIYKALINAYVERATSVEIKRVASVKPFEACFSTSHIGTAGPVLSIPTIEFDMWNRTSTTLTLRLFEPNSMVRVKKDVICLGFMDGGSNPRTSIVIGSHQLGDTILQFDIDSMKFGYVPSLRLFNTTCANFMPS